MSDVVSIFGVTADGCHGVLPEERTYLQPFVADIEVEVDTRQAAISDDVAQTISYSDVANDAVQVITGESVYLIETLASRIADRVLARGALSVTVTLHKPKAPVPLPFSDAQVRIHRDGPLKDSQAGLRHVVLALGANLGDTQGSLEWAIGQIRLLDVNVVAVSSFLRTAPVLAEGQAPQPDYLNAVVCIDTALAPLDLLAALERIEVRGGRVRHERWGARLLDIDIIDVEGVTSTYSHLLLPHPRAAERLFVLEPWHQIEPDATLLGRPISDLIDDLVRSGKSL